MALRLRPVRRADLDTLECWWADPGAQGDHNWFGFAPDGQLRRRFDQDGLLGPDRGNLLVELDDGTLAGDVSYFAVTHGPNPGSRAFNVGIALLPEHRGRGHGSEAQRLLAAYLFAHTTVERLEASTDVGNLAEQRALERAGFTREGVLRHAQFRAGEFHDLVLYSRLRGDRPSQG
ncbi:MAG TPA: GNAT family protein [Actinomycetota bacterium]|jgi:RimJ/RimL family protein N-acetyltransferase|nr:GNAT family protein [Actinomycetota bacterium]